MREVGICVDHDRCYVAAGKEGARPDIVLNALNERWTPSALAFDKGQWLVGQPALDLEMRNPGAATLDLVARLAEGGTISLGGEKISPPQAFATLLAKIREDAELRLGEKIGQVVLAVPSDFPPDAYAQVKAVAEGMNLQVACVVPKCAAVAIDHLGALSHGEGTGLLTLDLGHDRLNASLLLAERGRLFHLLTHVEPGAGCNRIRDAVVAFSLESVQKQFGIDGSRQPKFLRMLQLGAERAIRELQNLPSTCMVSIGSLRGDDGSLLDVEVDLSRKDYEPILTPAVDKAVAAALQTLSRTGLSIGQVNGVLLTGLPAGDPYFQRECAGRLGNHNLHPTVEESAAFGAARIAESGRAEWVVLVDDPVSFLREKLLQEDASQHPNEESAGEAAPQPPVDRVLAPLENSAPAAAEDPSVDAEEEPTGHVAAAQPADDEWIEGGEPMAAEPVNEVGKEPEPVGSEEAEQETAGERIPALEQTPGESDVPERPLPQNAESGPKEERPAQPDGPIPPQDAPQAGASQSEPEAETNSEDPSDDSWIRPEGASKDQSTPSQGTDRHPPEAGEKNALRFGRYRVLRLLSKGPFMKEYLAEDTQGTRRVRIKTYSMEDKRAKPAFANSLTLFHLHHPGLDELLDFGVSKGVLYTVAAQTDMLSLGELLLGNGRNRPLSIKHGLSIMIGLREPLRFIHGIRLFHRNIKPKNILIAPPGQDRVRLTGFEICRLLPIGRRCKSPGGTLAYMAPESFTGGADCSSDLYSAAVVLYEMVTGRVPFAGKDGEDLKRAVIEQTPVPPMKINPALPRGLNALIMQALEKDPVHRHMDWEGIREMLGRGPAVVRG